MSASPRLHNKTIADRNAQEHPHLTNREKEVLSLIASGCSNKYAARELQISPYTIAGYIKDIYRKLGICCRAEATMVAIKLGLLDTGVLVAAEPVAGSGARVIRG